MRVTLRPRTRARLAWGVPCVMLFALGYAMDRSATARRAASAEKGLEDLSARFVALSARLDDLASMQNRCAVVGLEAEGNEDRRSESAAGYPSASACPPPRVLGSGRSGPWAYTDVRLSDGAVRRYYVRTNSTPQQLLSVLSNMRADAEDSARRWRELAE